MRAWKYFFSLNLQYPLVLRCAVHFFLLLFHAGMASISSFYRRETLMSSSVRFFVCTTEARGSNAVQQTSQEFSFDAYHGKACDFIRVFGHSPAQNQLSATCSVSRGSSYIIESETRKFSFRTSGIWIAERRISHSSRASIFSFTYNKSFTLLRGLRLEINFCH